MAKRVKTNCYLLSRPGRAEQNRAYNLEQAELKRQRTIDRLQKARCPLCGASGITSVTECPTCLTGKVLTTIGTAAPPSVRFITFDALNLKLKFQRAAQRDKGLQAWREHGKRRNEALKLERHEAKRKKRKRDLVARVERSKTTRVIDNPVYIRQIPTITLNEAAILLGAPLIVTYRLMYPNPKRPKAVKSIDGQLYYTRYTILAYLRKRLQFYERVRAPVLKGQPTDEKGNFLLSTKQAAKCLGTSYITIATLAKRGVISSIRVNNKLWFQMEEIVHAKTGFPRNKLSELVEAHVGYQNTDDLRLAHAERAIKTRKTRRQTKALKDDPRPTLNDVIGMPSKPVTYSRVPGTRWGRIRWV